MHYKWSLIGCNSPDFTSRSTIHPVAEAHNKLTLKHREMHGCIVSTVATDAKAPGHQYPQYWLNIHFIGPVSCDDITNLLDNIRK